MNPYVRQDCSACGERLPWAECAAARRAARAEVAGDDKSNATVVVLCIVATFVGAMFVF